MEVDTQLTFGNIESVYWVQIFTETVCLLCTTALGKGMNMSLLFLAMI